MFSRNSRSARSFAGLTLGLLVGLASLSNPVLSQPTRTLKEPTNAPTNTAPRRNSYRPDMLIVMPDPKAERDTVKEALEEVHGTIVGTMGDGALKVYVIRTEKGQLEQTEAKLKKDKKDFRVVQKDYMYSPQCFSVNDPRFPSEWHLSAINAPCAWDVARGGSQRIAILDSGSQASVADLTGKTDNGYNANKAVSKAIALGALADPLGGMTASLLDGLFDGGADRDLTGHGTMVSTTAAATENNHVNGCGVAPEARVYPVHITDDSNAQGDEIAMMAGILHVMATHKSRIINISYGDITDPSDIALHTYFAAFHYLYGGLIFVSAGNSNTTCNGHSLMPYLQVVSAVDPSLSRASFSNFGGCITFAAPGQGIVLTDRLGNSTSKDGTSFASPICAAIAALIWDANPGLSNNQVIQIMKSTAVPSSSGHWNQFFGFGMPDANAAVHAAIGG
jgi:subtilisin family serine protease